MSSPGAVRTLDSLYAQAAEATRSGSRTLFFATRHFPPDLARYAHAVYWFCSYTRRIGRLGREDIEQWASLVNSGLRGRLARHPVLDVFLDTVDHRSIPHDYPLDLIEGVRMDFEQTRYRSFSQLRGLCHRITGTATIMMAHVVGFRDPALDYMADLGLAIELTAKLRNMGDDLTRDRIYLPVEEMEAFGYSETALRTHTRNHVFMELMRHQAERAHEYYRQAEPGLTLLNRRGRFAVKVAFDLNRQTLRRIEASNFDVFEHRPAMPAMERAWITARSMAGPITRRLWKAVGA